MKYMDLFYDFPHWNFVSKRNDYILSVRYVLKGNFHVLLRQSQGDTFIDVHMDGYYSGIEPKDFIKYLCKYRLDLKFLKKTAVYVGKSCVKNAFKLYEEKMYPAGYKVGVLNSREGQKSEEDLYNNKHETSSQDYLEFLQFLGKEIKLDTWEGYIGGLDRKYNGRHSIFNYIDKCPIMFHVSTLIPFTEHDEQQIERKRHLGNDIVIIIFKEGSEPFSPDSISSHFNHIFIVVQKNREKSILHKTTVYNVQICSKYGVGYCNPHIPISGMFEKSDNFRNWLLTKCINTEMAALYSEEFSAPLMRTRSALIEEICNECRNKICESYLYEM
eukprot:TRINITY_DN1697_c0_g2_i1.p1 TRINITY_DN1697_c0_g2~~TRINITY_DN1697_c0_g2_i1.p1  ORF type:complete len:329 (-),score=42.75 TRINITY_DN1697_c0_g2_i1:23-1009(-)